MMEPGITPESVASNRINHLCNLDECKFYFIPSYININNIWMTVKASVLNDSVKISKVVAFINFKVNHITNKTSIINYSKKKKKKKD